MSKYIIELDENAKEVVVISLEDGDMWTETMEVEDLEELNSDYINEHFGVLQDEAYQRGLDDAWKCMKKIAFLEKPRDMRDFWGHTTFGGILTGCTAAEAIEKLKAYEEKQKAEDDIKVGDEVSAEDGTSIFIVTWMSDRCICGVDKDGRCYSYEWSEILCKTGRHFDIPKILAEMRT